MEWIFMAAGVASFVASFVMWRWADKHLVTARGCLDEANAAWDRSGEILKEARGYNDRAIEIHEQIQALLAQENAATTEAK